MKEKLKFIATFLPLFCITAKGLSQTQVHFYAYRDALVEKDFPKSSIKGGEDKWVQDSIRKYFDGLTARKIPFGTAEDPYPSFIPLSQAAKDLFPKPKEKLWAFAAGSKSGEAKFLGVTRAVTYIFETDNVDEISFEADRKPLMEKCQSFSGYLAYQDHGGDSQWWDFENYEVVYVSVPAGTPAFLCPKLTHLPEAASKPLLDKVNRRLEKGGIEEKGVSLEMSIKALGDTYLVVNIHQPWDYCREVYRKTKNGFQLVYRNAINTAETD